MVVLEQFQRKSCARGDFGVGRRPSIICGVLLCCGRRVAHVDEDPRVEMRNVEILGTRHLNHVAEQGRREPVIGIKKVHEAAPALPEPPVSGHAQPSVLPKVHQAHSSIPQCPCCGNVGRRVRRPIVHNDDFPWPRL